MIKETIVTVHPASRHQQFCNAIPTGRRNEMLSLTKQGCAAFDHLQSEATAYNERLMVSFTSDEQVILRRRLQAMTKILTP
jgi:DNA-binding MarR family transcriptional regulator